MYVNIFKVALFPLAVCAQPWDTYNNSPASRAIVPLSVYGTTGDVVDITSASRRLATDAYRLTSPNASITCDFGKRIAGYPTTEFGSVNCTLCNTLFLPAFGCGTSCQGLGLAYTELAEFVGAESDDQTLYGHKDGTLFLPMQARSNYTVPNAWSRGSFQYITLSLSSDAQSGLSVDIRLRSVHFDAAPNLAESQLQQYTGYFHSSDEQLNQIWYAGAYTNQLCTITANSSVQHTRVITGGWSNDATADNSTPTEVLYVDGQRETAIPGQLGVRNTLRQCIVLQDPLSGFFGYAGSPLGDLLKLLGAEYVSDTYHLWTITNFADYVLATGDVAFGKQYLAQITRGMQATYQYVDANDGLYNGIKTSDWARIGQGGKNIALNSIYYHTLLNLARVTTYISSNNTQSASVYRSRAANVKASVNSQLRDASAGLYYDNTTTAGHQLYPTDGNTAAINFNLTTSPSQTHTIAKNLARRLSKFGSTLPELPGAMSPFASSQLLRAQFAASRNDSSRALDLIRIQWGYMISAFGSSTLVEGYNVNGSITYPFYPGDASFISAAHAWSTGPTYSLLASSVGLRASHFGLAVDEGELAFQPQVQGSGLGSAQGGFLLRAGEFNASWTVSAGAFHANLTTPAGTRGTIYVPILKTGQVVEVDGSTKTGLKALDGFYKLTGISGGSHSITTT